MSKCQKCGKGGLFLKTNLGLCEDCYRETYIASNNNNTNISNTSPYTENGGNVEGATGSYTHANSNMSYMPPVKKPFYKKTWFIVLCVFVAIGLIGSILGGSNKSTDTDTNTSTTTEATDNSNSSADDTTSSEPAEPAKPKMTISQEQAVKKAEEYLRYSSFSKKGLIGQLEFEGFSNKDAKFAVKNISVDWNEQAAKKAQEYLDYSSFSKKGLIEQLEYEGFTKKQAEYGAKAVGL